MGEKEKVNRSVARGTFKKKNRSRSVIYLMLSMKVSTYLFIYSYLRDHLLYTVSIQDMDDDSSLQPPIHCSS